METCLYQWTKFAKRLVTIPRISPSKLGILSSNSQEVVMRYQPDRFRLKKFYRYAQRVFSFHQHIKTLNDHRIAPDIQTEPMFEALFLCLLLRLGSFRALEIEMTHGQAQKVIRQPADFCINSLRYGLQFFEIQPLDEMLVSTMKQIKRSGMMLIPSKATMSRLSMVPNSSVRRRFTVRIVWQYT